MPRLPRVYVEGAIYYITCRAAQNEKLFRQAGDYRMYMELLENYKKEFGFKLFGFCLLPNHLHLLIEPSINHEISEIMRSLNTAYPKYYNAKYDRRGHLYRERFRACIVEKASFLGHLIGHIHQNPQRIGLVSQASQYSYSSFSKYATSPQSTESLEAQGFLPKGLTFESLIEKSMNAQERAVFYKRLKRGGILGSKDFINEAREKVNAHIEEKQEEVNEGQEPRANRAPALTVIFIALAIAAILPQFSRKGQLTGTGTTLVKIPNLTIAKLEDIDGIEWQLKLMSIETGETRAETMTFEGKKFISAFTSTMGFRPSNYSASQEGRKIIWETMQSYSDSQSSWRGEIEDNKMQGVLSLRLDDGSTQDFSFISLNYRRK